MFNIIKSNARRLLTVAVLAVTVLAVPAQAAIDLTDVTGEITLLNVAVVAAAGLVITAGIGLMAIKFGGKWLVRVFKSFSS